MNKTTDFLFKTFIYRVIIDFAYTLILSYIVFGRLSGSITYAVSNLFAGIVIYFIFINIYDRTFSRKIKFLLLGIWLLGVAGFITYVVINDQKVKEKEEIKAQTDQQEEEKLQDRRQFLIK